MSPASPGLHGTRFGFPRVSGDEPFIINTVYTSGMFSPRERG